MNEKTRRLLPLSTSDENLKELEEARQPGTTVSEVHRRYQLDANTFYRWENEAKAAMRDALSRKPRTRERTRGLPGWTVRRILERLGLSKARFHRWMKRACGSASPDNALADRSTASPLIDGILPVEKRAVVEYALAHPKDEYRRLAWQMVDAAVAYVSPSSVYRILSSEDLLYRWKRSARSGVANRLQHDGFSAACYNVDYPQW